jgi:4-amino-4-deoxy-L-arabinose transferase-like glycosyltransferase
LGLILIFAAALRLLYITAPLLDAHRWRQVDTAYVTQALYEGPFNPFEPEVNWGGAHGRAESEFPLLPAIVAAVYEVAGPDVTWGRLTVVLFSVGAVLLMYLLVRQLEGPAAGLAAATLVATSPGAVFYGRAFMPDSVMIFFSLGALLGFVRYFASGSRRALVLGSLCLGLTVLVKLPGVIVVAPVLAAAWSARRWGALRDRAFLLALVLPGVASLAWYAHAYGIYLHTGLTFGVFGTTKTYPLTVAPNHWPTAFSKWSSWDLLTSAHFYETMLTRLYYLHLTPAGFALSAVGLVLCRRQAWRRTADAWLVAMLAFILAAGEGNMGHDYYQLPLVPIAAIYFAYVAWPAFDADVLRRRVGAGFLPRAAMAVVIGTVCMLAFINSGVLERHFRPQAPDVRILRAGQAIDRGTEDGKLMVVVDDYGVNSPMLLYFARAKGWSLDAETVSARVVSNLMSQGARYFATTRWSDVRRRQPELAQLLATRQQIPLSGASSNTALFDLMKVR